MSLVSYENSDSSDVEEDTDTIPSANKDFKVTESLTAATVQNGIDSPVQDIFTILPKPVQNNTRIVEEDDEFLHKKEIPAPKPKAKISVPSLNDFKDIENPMSTKKPKLGIKKSGLLSMLPEPKYTGKSSSIKMLIPHVLHNPTTATVKKKALAQTKLTIKKLDASSSKLPLDYSDESDNDDVSNDFFSINKDESLLDLPKEDITSANLFNRDTPINSCQIVDETELSSNEEVTPIETQETNINSDVNTVQEIQVDDEALRQLCGSHSKRRKEEIQIIDIDGQQVLNDARQLLMKGLMDDTSKRVSSSKRKGNEPTTQQKRKHQITYLAHQAKAKEAELQNQWANNRMSRRQTQSKYGF